MDIDWETLEQHWEQQYDEDYGSLILRETKNVVSIVISTPTIRQKIETQTDQQTSYNFGYSLLNVCLSHPQVFQNVSSFIPGMIEAGRIINSIPPFSKTPIRPASPFNY